MRGWLVYHKLIPCPRHVKSQHPLGHARDSLVIAGFSTDGTTLVMTAMLASSLLYHLCWGCSFQNIFKCFLDRHSHPGSEFWSLRDRNLRQHEEKLTDMVPVTSPDSDHPAPNQQRGFQSVSSKLKFTLLRKRNYALSESHSNLGATPSDATGAYSPRMKDEMVLGSCLADTLIRFMK